MRRSAVTILCCLFALLVVAAQVSVSNAWKPRLIRVMSDVHAGSSWFTRDENHQAVMEFLQRLTDPATPVTDLVLLGDMFDFWMIPSASPMPPLTELMLNNQLRHGFNMTAYVQLIRRVAESGINVTFITEGNHDEDLNADLVRFAFGDQARISFVEDDLVIGDVLFQHGHQCDLFNHNDPRGIRSYGYYVTRPVASNDIPSPTTFESPLVKILLELWNDGIIGPGIGEMLCDQVFFNALIRIIMDAVLKFPSFEHPHYVFNGGDPYYKYENFTLHEVFPLYENLPSLLRQLKGYTLEDLSGLVKGSIGDHSYCVERADHLAVVHGHTHLAQLRTYKRPHSWKGQHKQDVVYANSGAWVDTAALSWVDIRFDDPALNNETPTEIQVWTYPDKMMARQLITPESAR